MLHLVAFINNLAIDRIDIRNEGEINGKGQTRYEVTSPSGKIPRPLHVWHRRGDGWMKLAEKAFRAACLNMPKG